METLYFKHMKPIYWKQGVGLDLVVFKDEACTVEAFRWPEFCAAAAGNDKGEVEWKDKMYKVVWSN